MRPYVVVDAFSAVPFLGNPVAVILDANGLSDAAMQSIARWTNLSETTFVLPPSVPGADYRLRIFTPGGELPFAGHPTLGSAHALVEAGLVRPTNGRIVQECKAGLIPVEVRKEGKERCYVLTLPEAKLSPLDESELDALDAALGAPIDRTLGAQRVNVGPVWIIARMADVDTLLALTPDPAKARALSNNNETGITLYAPYPAGHCAQIEVRSFAPDIPSFEDPVCGSGNGAVGVFRHASADLAASASHYAAMQGRCVARDGRIAVDVEANGTVRVGGACVTCARGEIDA